MFKRDTCINLAVISTLVEGVVGIGLTITYILLYSCEAKVHAGDENSSTFERVALTIYNSYINQGGCTYQGGEPAPLFNPNSKTKSKVVFIWQVVYLVLNFLWLFTLTLLHKSKRGSPPFVYPWSVVTSLIILVDLIYTSVAFTDLKVDTSGIQDTVYKQYHYTVVTLFILYCGRGGILWIYNILMLCLVLKTQIGLRGENVEKSPYWTNKGFEDIRRELSSKGNTSFPEPPSADQRLGQENWSKESDRQLDPGYSIPNRQTQNLNRQAHHYFVPSTGAHPTLQDPAVHHGYGHQGSGEQGYRSFQQRPISFKDRVREAQENKSPIGQGGMFRYPTDGAKLYQAHSKPDPDVDSTFNFLSKYDDKTNTEARRMSQVSSFQVSRNEISRPRGWNTVEYAEPLAIPRVKVATNLSRSSSLLREQEKKPYTRDYEARYFVPLKY